ncbi:MAG: hypothetical protein HOW73_29535 [Polyangiaceae bacterium]|nr:hypothetical protein [Polyangiaceae bacterium]
MSRRLVRALVLCGLLAGSSLVGCGGEGGQPGASATAEAAGSAKAPGSKEGATASPTGATAASAAPLKEGGVRFTYAPAVVGERIELAGSSTIDATVTLERKTTREHTTSKQRATAEVLEVKDGVSVKERVVVNEWDRRSSPPPFNKPFILSLAGEKIQVTDDKGAAAPASISEWFRSTWELGRKERFGNLLDGRGVNPGDELGDLTDLLAGFQWPGVKARRVMDRKVTFFGMDGSDARVDYAFDVELDLHGGTLVLKMQGKLYLAVPSGTAVKNELEWTFTAKSGDADVGSGKGKTVLTAKRTPPA